jgi:uncharacterized protein (DUF608 family)
VPGVFPAERVQTTLETLRKVNCALSQSGAVNYANADGSPARVGGYGTFSYFPPELFMLAMTYMYEGQREFGLDLLHRCLHNLMRWGYVWDAVLDGACRPDGFVARVLAAANPSGNL